MKVHILLIGDADACCNLNTHIFKVTLCLCRFMAVLGEDDCSFGLQWLKGTS